MRRDIETAFKRAEAEIDAVSMGGIILSNTVTVNDVSKLPTPVGTVITLEAKAYMWDGQVDIGLNRLVAVPGTVLYGHTFVGDGIVRSGAATGALLTVPAANGSVIVKNLRLAAPTGSTIFDVNGSFPAQSTNFFASSLDCEGDIGSIEGTIIRFSATSFTGWDDGMSVAGVLSFGMTACSMRQTSGGTGAGLDFTGVAVANIDIKTTNFDAQENGTAINGLASSANLNAAAIGYLTTCKFTGLGTYVAGITEDDGRWSFVGNTGITNSSAIAAYTMSGNAVATTTAGQAWTKLLGTTVSTVAKRFDNSVSNRSVFDGGLSPKLFRADIAVAARASVNGTDAEFGISVNGSDPVVGIPVELSNNKDSVLTFFGVLTTFSDDDYVEVWCRDSVGTASITAATLSVMVSALADGV